jgi:hypothetical protein
MKNVRALATLGAILIFSIACNPFDRSGRSFTNISYPRNEQRVVIRYDNTSLDIKYSGDIEFNDEETAIEKMSPGGYLDYRKNDKRLLAEAVAGGDVVYKFYNDEDYQTEEGSGRKFLAEAIGEMISQGLFINGRMERFFQEGGIPLLLTEVKRINADNVKRKYFEYMLQSDSVSQEDMTDISNAIAKMMTSDDDKRRILEKVPANYLKDSVTAAAYFAAIESINSDNDKANALRETLKEPLSEPAFKFLLKAAATINSDNDKANLLKDLVKNNVFPGENYDSLLGVIKTINSDNDKTNVLKALINKQIYPNEQFSRLLAVVSEISSDNDKANVFKKLAERNISKEEDWINLINEITSINSDNDKSDVLRSVSRNMPRSEKIIAAYMKSSRTISSEHDYQITVKSVQ